MTDTASRRVAGEWAHFTPHLPEVIDDPYPAFRWLRHNAPAFYVESEDIWVLSRYDDVVAAARDPQTFSQTESVGYSRHRGKGLALTALDPPDHTELRRLTAPIFSPRSVATHRADAVALLDELLDDAIDAPETGELRRGCGQPLPLAAGRRDDGPARSRPSPDQGRRHGRLAGHGR